MPILFGQVDPRTTGWTPPNQQCQSTEGKTVFVSLRNSFIYALRCPSGPGLDMPMLLDVSGFFLRREGLYGDYVCSAIPSLVRPSKQWC